MVSVQDQSFLNADSECRCLMFCFLVPHTRRILCLREESFTGAHEKYSSYKIMWLLLQTTSPPETLPRNRKQKSVWEQILFPVWKRAILWHVWGMWHQILQLQPPYFSNTNTQALQLISANTYSLSRWGTDPLQFRTFFCLSVRGVGWLLAEHQPKFGSTQGSRVTYLLAFGHEDGPSEAAAWSICVYNSPYCCWNSTQQL